MDIYTKQSEGKKLLHITPIHPFAYKPKKPRQASRRKAKYCKHIGGKYVNTKAHQKQCKQQFDDDVKGGGDIELHGMCSQYAKFAVARAKCGVED